MAEIPESVLSRLPARVWLVLEEDDYETKYGDGRFLYAREVFWDEASARSRRSTTHTLHVRPIDLRREGNRIIADVKPGPDEHYTLEKVVELLSAAR